MDSETATPPPAFSFPPPDLTPDPVTEHQQHIEVSVLMILALLLVVFGLGIGAAYLIFKPQQAPASTTTAVTPTPAPTIATTQLPRDPAFPKMMVYFRGANLYRMDLMTKEEKEVLLERNAGTVFKQPMIVDANRVSFIRCEQVSTDPKSQTMCSIRVKSLDTGAETELVKKTSQPNSTGYQVGGMIRVYTWNPARTQVAFAAEEPTIANGQMVSKVSVNLLTVATGSYATINTLDVSGGRGGSPDDDQSMVFSPDGSKFLFTDTTLYPALPISDNGTMFVYDAYGVRLMWSQKAAWTTFGTWLDNQTVIAKQTPSAPGATASASLMRLNIYSGAYQYLRSDIQDWVRLDVLPPSTVTFYSPKPPADAKHGVLLQSYDLTTNTVRTIKEQVMPVRSAGGDYLIVQLTKPCTYGSGPEFNCEVDYYNGVLIHGLGILKASTGDIESLLSGGDTASITSLDIK